MSDSTKTEIIYEPKAAWDRGFPLGALPKPLRDMVTELHDKQNFPTSYTAASMLFAIASAMGNTKCLRFQPQWEIRPVLFLCLIGEPGANKSAPLNWALAPLEEINSRLIAQYNREYAEFKLSGGKGLLPEPKQCIVTDITTEAVAKVLSSNPRGLCYYCDELSGWFGSFNQYKGGGGRDEEFWLSAYSLKSITINRKSDSSVINIKNPFICVAGTMQPRVLVKFLSGNSMSNGMTWRILQCYSHEESNIILWKQERVNENLAKDWSFILNSIYEDQQHFNQTGEPEEWYMTDDARKYITEWQNVEEEVIDNICTEEQRAAFRKIQEYALRFCLIVHQMWIACGSDKDKRIIDINDAINAVSIAEFFYREVCHTIELIHDSDKNTIPIMHQQLLSSLKDNFTTQDAYYVSKKFKISDSSVNRFLKRYNGTLFKKVAHGKYTKIKDPCMLFQ